MLSILIPVHNYTCTPLVSSLLKMRSSLDVEIIVAEDGSTDAISLASNKWIEQMPDCRYLPFQENRGRAAIRNLLAEEARGELLLFLDADVTPVSSDFLQQYSACTTPVVCGGVQAAATPQKSSLRWVYDNSMARKLTPETRSLHPYNCFTTQNFLISKDIFLSIRFDESITEYGYEDALFGIELQKHGISIAHIDAPVHHEGVEPNAQYLAKVEQALRTLTHLPQMQPHTPVARWASRTRFLSPLLRLLSPLLRRNLLSRHPRFLALQLYKLCYYHRL